ncbi:MAG TPA: AAA family ATPase [Planctomycetota bacterium]|nr:AAA family ATPase [Planctomycetota bacterium]
MAQNASFPSWANDLAEKYRGGTIIEFIVHGAVLDLVRAQGAKGGAEYVSLKTFLEEHIFPRRDAVITYDVSRGLTFTKEETAADFNRVVQAIDTASGTNYAAQGLPRDARRALYLIERYLRAKVDPRGPVKPKSVGVILDFANMICPAGDPSHMSSEEQATLVTLLRWANEPVFVNADLTVILVCENLAELSPALVKSPFIGKVEIKLPEEAERREFLEHRFQQLPALQRLAKVETKVMAKLTAGLSRVNLHHVTAQAAKNEAEITGDFLNKQKKDLIEKECYGLLEFLAPRYTMDAVSGHGAVKQWLEEDAKLIREGRVDALPMGYLIMGPVGTGKTFLIQCYTGSIGIPCVKLLNFRSQWQGVTEGNWEKILNVLKATGPVGVIIDEADAALGQRDSSGDSGTSSRIFSQLAATMGDTRYRGHILWFLITCRPDILPIDLKRQGRAEVHIPLFYPESEEEQRTMFKVLAKKIGANIAEDALKDVVMPKRAGTVDLGSLDAEGHDHEEHEHDESCEHGDEQPSLSDIVNSQTALSGAEIEALLVRVKRRAYLNGREQITKDDVDQEAKAFSPSLSYSELALQIASAIVECSDKRFLPEKFRHLDRGQLQLVVQKLAELY